MYAAIFTCDECGNRRPCLVFGRSFGSESGYADGTETVCPDCLRQSILEEFKGLSCGHTTAPGRWCSQQYAHEGPHDSKGGDV